MQENKTRLDEGWNLLTELGSRHGTLLDAFVLNVGANFKDTITEFKEALTWKDHSRECLEYVRKKMFSTHYKNGIRILRRKFNGSFLEHIAYTLRIGKNPSSRTENEALQIFKNLEMAKEDTKAKEVTDYLIRENVLITYSDQGVTHYKIS